MQGNIIYVDYERSSWRYMSYERAETKEDLDAYKIGGTFNTSYDTISPYMVGKGGGSAYGGQWKPNPNKPQDAVFKGPPNTIQRMFIPTNKGGFWVTAKYNENGDAILIRHETGHSPGSGHSNPHDHKVSWNNPDHHPQQSKPINYPNNNAPEFKMYSEWGIGRMNINNLDNIYKFSTISEFKTCMRYGGEVVIEWQGEEYGIWSEDGIIRITSSTAKIGERVYNNADDALEYMVGENRLRDVITQVMVIERTI